MNKITPAELTEIFGVSIPLEAVPILQQEEVDVETVRVQLRELADRERNDEIKQVIVMRHDLKMRLGKAVAQACHASMGPILKAFHEAVYDQRMAYARRAPGDLQDILPPDYMKWLMTGTAKIVARVNSLGELNEIRTQAMLANLPVYTVTDAGRTEFKGPTVTCCVIGPAKVSSIDLITGHLSLM